MVKRYFDIRDDIFTYDRFTGRMKRVRYLTETKANHEYTENRAIKLPFLLNKLSLSLVLIHHT